MTKITDAMQDRVSIAVLQGWVRSGCQQQPPRRYIIKARRILQRRGFDAVQRVHVGPQAQKQRQRIVLLGQHRKVQGHIAGYVRAWGVETGPQLK